MNRLKEPQQYGQSVWLTSTKNPNYRDVLYVEELIGRDTVNTIPPATFDAFRDHGAPRASLEADLEDAHDAVQALERPGISMKRLADQLFDEGVGLFADAFAKLLAATLQRRRQPREGSTGRPGSSRSRRRSERH